MILNIHKYFNKYNFQSYINYSNSHFDSIKYYLSNVSVNFLSWIKFKIFLYLSFFFMNCFLIFTLKKIKYLILLGGNDGTTSFGNS